jgi:UDP-N-acetylmuramoyl-tripeptide--D-alanyl-D-alanine ligase
MRLWREIRGLYGSAFSRSIVYMLQSTEYRVGPYLKWLWRAPSFRNIAYRRDLVMTKAAKLLLLALRLGIILNLLSIIWCVVKGYDLQNAYYYALALILLTALPIIWSHMVILPIWLGRIILTPTNNRRVKQARLIFKNHPGLKIAIAGSYGKTTMKEILQLMLAIDKKVAATQGNKNVPLSHARFARSLKGDEDVLIIEYGEGAPGDVAKFARNTHPNVGIITGLAPAHLDKYKSLKQAGHDIFSLAGYLKDKNVYVNDESEALKDFIKPAYHLYDRHGVLGWKVSDIKNNLDGLSFKMTRANETINVKTKLLGEHLVGPIALAAAFVHQAGCSAAKIEDAAKELKPYEHRMKPYQLAGGWVIDDTYNGNIDGMRAGLALLKQLPAKRKIYVTPGLVDQGKETKAVHQELGRLIAEASPDKVILMQHSVMTYILDGMAGAGYRGEVDIEEDPLNFYSNLDHFIAAGDLVLLQNDWTDNYN